MKKDIEKILQKLVELDVRIDALSKQLLLQQADLALLIHGSYKEHATTDDEMYEEARERVIEYQKASTSLLQRVLNIGYARAAHLMDRLEEDGVIGPGDGAHPRDVLIKPEE